MNDILFINPGNHKGIYQDLAAEFTAVDVPVWTLLLAESLRRKNKKISIYDVNVEGWSEEKCQKLLINNSSKLIVLMVYGHHPSASTQTMPAAIKIVNDLKNANSDLFIAVGGTHPSTLPEDTLNEMETDVVIKGEGLYSLYDLIDYKDNKITINKVRGIYYKDNKKVCFTECAPLIENLDEELPGYAFDLLPDINNYRAHNWHCFQDFEKSKKDDFSDIRSPYVSIYTSLGCPFNCSYCCINSLFGKPGIRFWSMDKVLSWIDELVVKYKVKNIRIADELFILKEERVEYFCDKIIEKKYNLNFWVYARVDTIKENLLKKMKKAGINWLALGIESGDEKVRDGANKKIRKPIKESINIIKESGINTIGNFMFGLPDDSLESMEKTYRLAEELQCEFINFYSCMAYPGSSLFKYYYKNKKEDLPEKWEDYSQHGYATKPLPTKYLKSNDVLKFRDKAFENYFNNEKFLIFFKNKFGEKAYKHILKMRKHKLKRKILE